MFSSHHITSHHVSSHYIALYCIILHCITSNCIPFHDGDPRLEPGPVSVYGRGGAVATVPPPPFMVGDGGRSFDLSYIQRHTADPNLREERGVVALHYMAFY